MKVQTDTFPETGKAEEDKGAASFFRLTLLALKYEILFLKLRGWPKMNYPFFVIINIISPSNNAQLDFLMLFGPLSQWGAPLITCGHNTNKSYVNQWAIFNQHYVLKWSSQSTEN